MEKNRHFCNGFILSEYCVCGATIEEYFPDDFCNVSDHENAQLERVFSPSTHVNQSGTANEYENTSLGVGREFENQEVNVNECCTDDNTERSQLLATDDERNECKSESIYNWPLMDIETSEDDDVENWPLLDIDTQNNESEVHNNWPLMEIESSEYDNDEENWSSLDIGRENNEFESASNNNWPLMEIESSEYGDDEENWPLLDVNTENNEFESESNNNWPLMEIESSEYGDDEENWPLLDVNTENNEFESEWNNNWPLMGVEVNEDDSDENLQLLAVDAVNNNSESNKDQSLMKLDVSDDDDDDENWPLLDIESESERKSNENHRLSDTESKEDNENYPLVDIESDVEDESQNAGIEQYGHGYTDRDKQAVGLIDIISRNKRTYKTLNASGLRLEVKFKPPAMDDIVEWLKLCISELLIFIEHELAIEPQDRVGIIFTNTNNSKVDFSISFRPFSQYSTESILFELGKVIQSNSLFFTDDNLVVNIDHVRIPVGYGRRSHIGKSSDRYYKMHERSIFSPKLHQNDYGMCLAVSIVVAIAYSTNDINSYNYLTYSGNYAELIKEAQTLCSNANVNLQYGGGLDEIIQFQQYLGYEYRLVVYASRDGKVIYFKACHDGYIHTLNILLDENHYSVILKPTAAFATAYFCGYCCVGYSTELGHKRCRVKCNKCFQTPPCPNIASIKCSSCKREFANATCLQNHILYGICEKYRICQDCCVTYTVKKTSEHVCGVKYCKICKEDRPIRHECYIAITKCKRKSKNGVLYIFYDFECYQTKCMIKNDPSKKEHEVNLCVSHQACDKCRDSDKSDIYCNFCGKREHIFWGNNIVSDFMEYLGEVDDKFKKIIVIAHNSQRYDSHFILRYMYANSEAWKLNEHSLIINGTKIMRIKVGRYNFIDSMNFFSVGLAKLPAMFSLENNCKGYYPHAFNTPENLDYIGKLPDIKYFWPDNLKSNDRKKLLEWHALELSKNVIFNNKNELLKYCREDVNILRMACLKFRDVLYTLTEVEPFYQTTLAGTAMTVFTTKFMDQDQIAIIPRNGYRFTDNQSFKAIKWLEWEAYVRKVKIHSAANGREVRISDNILVDGFVPPNTVFSFLGCYWHQCVKCFPNQYHNNPDTRKTKMSLLYESCVLRAKKIREFGYELIEMWEHEFDDMLKTNPEINVYINTLDHLKFAPLDPRDAFMGGRTGVCKMYHKVRPGEKILYSDVTSLYPYVNKYGCYPIGVPKILLGSELENRNVFNIDGILKVDILPPKRLYHPVLGIKMHNKLIFSLCYSCTKDMNDGECIHSPEDRLIHGTYVADELRLAVRNGYIVRKIYEAWEYETTQYDKHTQRGGIFGKYIDTFLKIKTEASGYPQHCTTPNDKEQFINDFETHEGILLDRNQMSKNQAYRALAKLLLNSLWGRLGMRQDKSKKVFVKSPNQLLNLMTNPSFEVNNFFGLSDDTLLVSYKYRSECMELNPKVNVVLAAYTTALARIHLYGYLEKLQTRCLYYDTDSVIYTCTENEQPLPLGDYLGDLTDELADDFGENSFISEAVFTAEKSYSFVVNTPNKPDTYVCKVKGITLNHDSATKINFESMKNLVLNDRNGCIDLKKDSILRSGDSIIYTAAQKYKFKVNANKRVKIGDDKIETRPYGFY